jgi:hypothetical protein
MSLCGKGDVEELYCAWSRGAKTTREVNEEQRDVLGDFNGAPSSPKPELEYVSIVSILLTSSIERRDLLIMLLSS